MHCALYVFYKANIDDYYSAQHRIVLFTKYQFLFNMVKCVTFKARAEKANSNIRQLFSNKLVLNNLNHDHLDSIHNIMLFISKP